MKKWSDDMLEGAIDLLKQGKNYNEIGFIYNKSYNSVRSKLYKYSIKTSDYIEYEKHKIKCCLECGKRIDGYKKFCNNSCAASYNNKYRIRNKDRRLCINCGKEILTRNTKKYCSNVCQCDFEKKEFIKKWKNNEISGITGSIGETSQYIKNYIIEKYENKCARCGWNEMNPYTNKIPLQVEHIDGNYANNKEENLILLCPSCHSLTPTYGARNKGKGRPRYKNVGNA